MSGRSNAKTTLNNEILSWLQQREDEMATLLAELVAIPTENPPGTNYRECADLLENSLLRAGLDCERLAAGYSGADGDSAAECLLAFHGSGERALYFHGHYDVVPAQSREQFQPSRKEHFLFGRGSCDMKGGIVAMLYAICALI
jgi:acetylornithine deacetylase/succinyl-diaminopimelate desuccinylase-like protein